MSLKNKETISHFYEAFNRKQAEKMVSFYSDGIEFSDPVFPSLKGESAKNMWRMLCSRSADLQIAAESISADDSSGSCTWVATYTFAQTGRKVRNEISAKFQFRDGKIILHQDHFSFWKWSRQALGPVGLFLGWNPLFLRSVRKKANISLSTWAKKHR